jgi:hypothetical protein
VAVAAAVSVAGDTSPARAFARAGLFELGEQMQRVGVRSAEDRR